jgi:putative membrane protein
MRQFSISSDRGDPWAPSTLALRFVVNLAGLWIASKVIPGIHIDDMPSLLAGTAIFAIVNVLLKPLATMISCCLIVFMLVINALLLVLTSMIAERLDFAFRVDGFWAAFFGGLVISLVSIVASLFVRPPRVRHG